MENYDIYPAKPHIEKVKIESNWGLTAFSLVAINKMSLIYNHGLNILFCKRQVNARL